VCYGIMAIFCFFLIVYFSGTVLLRASQWVCLLSKWNCVVCAVNCINFQILSVNLPQK